MNNKDLNKKMAILEKRIEYLESKLIKKNSNSLRDEKWNEFQTIIRLQEKNSPRKNSS